MLLWTDCRAYLSAGEEGRKKRPVSRDVRTQGAFSAKKNAEILRDPAFFLV
jgi:hypothetical protein